MLYPLGTYLKIAGNLILSINQNYHMPAHQSIWLSNSNIIKTQMLNRKIILTPKKEGRVYIQGHSPKPSNLIVLNTQDYQTIKKCPLQFNFKFFPLELNSPLKHYLKNYKNCRFSSLALPKKLQSKNLNLFLSYEKKLITNNIQITQAVWEKGKRVISIKSPQSPKIVSSKAKTILNVLAPFYTINTIKQSLPGSNISFEISFLEFSRSQAEHLGIEWPTSLSVELPDFKKKLILSPLKASAHFSEGKTWHRTLAQPFIRTKPGVEASFQTGGELPIRNKSFANDQTQWKKYGLIIKLIPHSSTQPGDQHINVDFKLELSEPNFNQKIGDLPSLKMRKLDNKMDLRVGETTLLTTMIHLSKGDQIEGVNRLQHIPLLGYLFKHKSPHWNDSELMIAIKPTWQIKSTRIFKKHMNTWKEERNENIW